MAGRKDIEMSMRLTITESYLSMKEAESLIITGASSVMDFTLPAVWRIWSNIHQEKADHCPGTVVVFGEYSCREGRRGWI